MGFGVWGLRFGVYGLGFGVFRVAVKGSLNPPRAFLQFRPLFVFAMLTALARSVGLSLRFSGL